MISGENSDKRLKMKVDIALVAGGDGGGA